MPDITSHTMTTLAPERRKPGLILDPFGWAAGTILRLALLEPRLLTHLMDLDRLRLHAMVLYLAHRNERRLSAHDAAMLATARTREIAAAAIGRPPQHLLGLLRRLPEYVLKRDSYTYLADVDTHHRRCQFLLTSHRIIDLTLSKLSDVPDELLPLLDVLRGDLLKVASVAQVCRWLERRWQIDAVPSFAAARSLDQVRQIAIDLLRLLPPIGYFPPRNIGNAYLIESADELRRVGRAAKNCLGNFAGSVSLGVVAFYVWKQNSEEGAIYIQVRRPIGFGWFISDMKLAGNGEVPPTQSAMVEKAFEAAGVDRSDVADSLTSLLVDDDTDIGLLGL